MQRSSIDFLHGRSMRSQRLGAAFRIMDTLANVQGDKNKIDRDDAAQHDNQDKAYFAEHVVGRRHGSWGSAASVVRVFVPGNTSLQVGPCRLELVRRSCRHRICSRLQHGNRSVNQRIDSRRREQAAYIKSI